MSDYLPTKDGERVRAAVRALTEDAHAALIHHSGEDVDVVRVIDLVHAIGDHCGNRGDDCDLCPPIEEYGP